MSPEATERRLAAIMFTDIVGSTAAGEPRTPTVAEDTCLLRITPDSLERLRRRNPRIAAKVFRNLNAYQAVEGPGHRGLRRM
jgi:hypothetical protein